MPLFRGSTKPLCGLCIVLRDACTPVVRHAQVELRLRKPLFGGSTKRCSGVIRLLRDAFSRDR